MRGFAFASNVDHEMSQRAPRDTEHLEEKINSIKMEVQVWDRVSVMGKGSERERQLQKHLLARLRGGAMQKSTPLAHLH